jgi:hypothetical protein
MNQDSSVSEWVATFWKTDIRFLVETGFRHLFHFRLPTVQFTFSTATETSFTGLKQPEI